MKTLIMATLFLAWAGVAGAQPWIPLACKTNYVGQWNEFSRKMREASPGSQIYVPKPFPKSDTEVVEDFKYGYFQMFKGMGPDQLPRQEWPLYTGIQQKALTFQVVRVENWAPNRCRPDRQRDFFYLLHIIDSVSGREIGRAYVNQNGLLGGWAHFPEQDDTGAIQGPKPKAPRLAVALEQVRAKFGVKGTRPQYVSTWGMPACDLYLPCVAFQAGGRNYLFQNGDLVEFTLQSRGYSRAEMEATRTRRFEISGAVNPEKEWLVSLGDQRSVLATRVKPIR
jgi:hypothetical protein